MASNTAITRVPTHLRSLLIQKGFEYPNNACEISLVSNTAKAFDLMPIDGECKAYLQDRWGIEPEVWIGKLKLFDGEVLPKYEIGKGNILVRRESGYSKSINSMVYDGEYMLLSNQEATELLASLSETHFCLCDSAAIVSKEFKKVLEEHSLVNVIAA